MKSLKVCYSVNDYSLDADNYLTDSFSVGFLNLNYLYIGFYKPFRDIYIELEQAGTALNGKFEYYNGASWVELNTIDETKSLNRSGFVNFWTPLDWGKFTALASEGYYIRYSQEVEEEIIFKGISAVFANDNDLKEKYENIDQLLPRGASSFIRSHQAVKKDMIQKLRNLGNVKIEAYTGKLLDLTIWDLLDRQQLRNAGAYYALENIFDGVSDTVGDKYSELASKYKKKADDAFKTYSLSLDKNDNGLSDSEEMNSESIQTTLIRYI